MSVESGDMRRLAAAAQEDLRLRGVAALERGAGSEVRPGRRGLQSVRAVGGHLVAAVPGSRQAVLAAVRQPRPGMGEFLDASASGAALQAMRRFLPAPHGADGLGTLLVQAEIHL